MSLVSSSSTGFGLSQPKKKSEIYITAILHTSKTLAMIAPSLENLPFKLIICPQPQANVEQLIFHVWLTPKHEYNMYHTVKNIKSDCYSNPKESGEWDMICKPAHWMWSLIHCSLASVFKIMIKQFFAVVLIFTNEYKPYCDSNSNVPWGRWYSGVDRHNKNIYDLEKQWIRGVNRRLTVADIEPSNRLYKRIQ